MLCRKEIGVSKVIVHENFTFGELADDVALLRLSKPFFLNNGRTDSTLTLF